MHKLIGIFVLAYICFAGYARAGEPMDFVTVDSLTYSYYSTGNWNELIKTGKEAVKQGYDYYYLHIRMGIAYYHTQTWYKAEKSFKRALKKSPNNQVALEYLYWVYVEQGNQLMANEVYKSLGTDAREDIKNKRFMPVSDISVDGGVKFSANPSVAGNVYFVGGGLGHKIGYNLQLQQNYMYVTQNNNDWGNYYQHQYFIGGNGYVKKGWQIDFGTHLANYHSTLQFMDTFTVYQLGPPPAIGQPRIDSVFNHHDNWTGKYLLNSWVSSFGFTKSINRFKVGGFVNFQYEWEDPDYNINIKEDIKILHYMGTNLVYQGTAQRERNDVKNTLVTRWQLTPGLHLAYTLPFLQDRITLGCKMYIPFNADTAQFIFSPHISVRFTRWLWMYTNYMYKGSLPVAENNAGTFWNSYDQFKRITVSFTALAFKRLYIYLAYQHDLIRDSLTYNNYQLNSILCGLKFRF